MASVKELSKLKTELLERREKSIKGSLSKQQDNLYESIIDDFIKIAKNKTIGKSYDIYVLQQKLKKEYNNEFPALFSEVIKASNSIGELNLQYFSTLVETSSLITIKENVSKVINKSIGITDKGKLKTGGFIDKIIADKTVQKRFTKEVKLILEGSPDVVLMQQKLKEFIIGSDKSTGILERHYRTFANDLISNIDSTGSLIYADELGLNNFLYNGGIILSSRSFCKSKNGKVFSRKEAKQWKFSKFITEMYGVNISDYEPLVSAPGGYGCKHRYDWITDDLAKSLR